MPITPNRLFLLDGVGASLTVLLLVAVVAQFEPVFGMPRRVVYGLSGIAAVFAAYSITCHCFVGQRWRTYLRGIAVANLLYCCLTLGLVLSYWQRLTGWGVSYFLLEIGVVIGLAVAEWRAIRTAAQ